MPRRLKCFIILAFCVSAGAGGASAQGPALPAELNNCLGIFGAVERLACYDRIAHGVGGPAGVPRPAAVAPAYSVPVYTPPPAAMVAPQAQFGAEKMQQPQTSGNRIAALTSPVTEYRLNPDGKFTLALANGQVWKQLDGDTLAEMPKSHRVKITHGFFGSYNLVFVGSNVLFKVTRLK